MKYNELMIGDFVLIDGIERRIEVITKKKIGFHYGPNECNMHYRHLCDVFPVPLGPDTFESLYKGCSPIVYEWDDESECKHTYILRLKGTSFYIMWLHQLQQILRLYSNYDSYEIEKSSVGIKIKVSNYGKEI